MKIITNISAMTDATLTKWAGADKAEVHRIKTLNAHPKKIVNGTLENVKKSSTIIQSVVSLYGVSDTHYVFRVDLTSLLGFTYQDEGKMKTGISFKLAKTCFDDSFHARIAEFVSNFTRFSEWRASQWDNLIEHSSEWSRKNQKTAPGIYFNADTAFNSTMCSWNKLSDIAGLNTKGIDKAFVDSCIIPTFQMEQFALAYIEKPIEVNGNLVTQKVIEAFDYRGLTIESFRGGAQDVTDRRGDSGTNIFALMAEDGPGDGVVAPAAPKTKYVVVDGVAYPVAA